MTLYTHIRKYAFALLAIALLLCSCRKSYPGIEYIEEEILLKDEYNKIPIIVAVDDPLMISTSRGVGPLDDSDDESDAYKKWISTKFYVYAFLARNSKYIGPVDYRATMNASDEEDIFCLVSDTAATGHGKCARMNSDMSHHITWENENEILYYNLTYQDYRYNFFAYHIDDAAINGIKKERDNVELDLTIDGSQDLMVGVAAPTAKQIDKLCEDSKWTAARIHDLAYSTTTGHRDVVPVIAMEHLLSRFSFKLTGRHEEAANISVHNIYVKSKNRGLMTVAADDTTRLGLIFPDSLNPIRDEWATLYLPIIEDDTMRTDGFTKKYNVTLDSTYVIGEDILLPAGETFTLVLECTQTEINKVTQDTTIISFPAKYDLKLTGGKQFEPGVKYIVNVNVYGMQKINIMIDGIGWIQGEEFELGEGNILPF